MAYFARHIFLTWTIVAALQTIVASAAWAVAAPTVDVLVRRKAGISSPLRIAGDSDANLFVSDPREGGVLKFDNTGRLLKTLPVASPGGVALTRNGGLVVSQGTFVSLLDANGVEVGKLGKGVGQFKLAKGVAVDAAGYIYVVDSADYCVQVFNASGQPVAIGTAAAGKPFNSFGSFGMLPNQFYRPTGITYEKAANQLAVVDSLNGRVQFFSTSGEFQKVIGTLGAGPMRFTSPHAAAFEYSSTGALSRMYVVDSFQSNVQVIDPSGNGTFLRFIGSYGSANGQLEVPTDAIFDHLAKRLVVVNSRGNLTMYGIDGGTSPDQVGTGPTVSIDAIPTITSPSAVISGQVSPGAVVTVNGMPATVNDSTWHASITGLTQGKFPVTVRATDKAGNSQVATTTINVDIALPQFSVNPIISVTNISSQDLTGTMEEGVAVTMSVSTAAVAGAVSYPTSTTWRCTVTGLVQGANKISIYGSKGGATAKTEVTIRLDQALLQVSALSDGSVTTVQTQNVSGAVASVIGRVSVNGTDVIITNGRFSVPVVLDFGPNQILVEARDRSGNLFTDSRTITFDPAMPTITIDAPADGSLIKSSTLTVTGTATAGSSVLVNGQNANISGTTWSAVVNLIPGINTIEATVTVTGPQTSTVSNVKRIHPKVASASVSSSYSSSVKRTVIYNAVGVDLAITGPLSDIITNRSSLTVTGYALGASNLTLSAVLNGVTTPLARATDGSFTTTVELPVAGTYDLMIVAADTAGNASTIVRNVVYETAAPKLELVANSSKPGVLTATIDPGDTVSLTDKDGNPVGSIEIKDGKFDLPSNYDPAVQLLTVVSAAGNSSRNGDTNSDGKVNIFDALKVMRMATGLDKPTQTEMLHSDMSSSRGVGKPDGKIDLLDVFAVMHKVVGL